MTDLKKKILDLATEYHNEVIEIRRHFHAYPELSMKEFKTSEYIASKLSEYGIPYETGIAETGIVGMIEGRNPSMKVVGLRADMDALPIIEKNDVSYCSTVPGVMHACGHDVHMASLLGTAKILKQLENDISGSVKLIFQPSEETYPGGASMMIDEGVLENPKVDVMFGQHVYPGLDAGSVGMKEGQYMASSDEFFTITGRGGHGATPDLNIDPIVISAHIILALQNITSRFAAPMMPTVVSIGKVAAEGKTNVIPDHVVMEGIIRTFDNKWRNEIREKIKEISHAISNSMGGSCEFFLDPGYPFLVNDVKVTRKARKWTVQLLGKKHVNDLDLRMTAEDFAYYTQKVPACYYRLGIRNENKGITSNLHSARFDVDEKCLETGMACMSWITVCELMQ